MLDGDGSAYGVDGIVLDSGHFERQRWKALAFSLTGRTLEGYGAYASGDGWE
ncbi:MULTISPECIES: hypothetical protein [Streptomyces]|uniref:Uncharacterized protein n=1 Tax=Streptomyces microflavus TaxID=1919 RepID=A0A7J0D679_STRMI|nr:MULTISPECIES: hypothetical protein [Streptomyces]GFN09949.1 hypothetical protein Smic_85050 [Streptomyces microflavus]